MFRHQTLRDLVNERLNAAAEEIFALFEMTIIEYEEELCRYKETSQRNQQCLNQVLNPSISLPKVPSPLPPPHGPDLKLEITETSLIKEETQEQLSTRVVPEATKVKTEDPSVFLQIYPEDKETQGEDINSEPQIHSQSEWHRGSSHTDNDDDDENMASQIETEAGGLYSNHIQITEMQTHGLNPGIFSKYTSAPGTSAAVEKENLFGTGQAPKERRKHQCAICPKTFRRRLELERHIRVHTGERPYGCSVCAKSFVQKVHLEVHMRTHSSEKPYSCTFCSKTFSQKNHLSVHLRTHTGERPFRCPVCKQTFTQNVNLQRHMMFHTEGNPEQNSMTGGFSV